MEVQTRNEAGEILQHNSLRDAFEHSKNDPTVWKISFDLPTHERFRMIRTDHGWVYEDINGNKEV